MPSLSALLLCFCRRTPQPPSHPDAILDGIPLSLFDAAGLQLIIEHSNLLLVYNNLKLTDILLHSDFVRPSSWYWTSYEYRQYSVREAEPVKSAVHYYYYGVLLVLILILILVSGRVSSLQGPIWSVNGDHVHNARVEHDRLYWDHVHDASAQ